MELNLGFAPKASPGEHLYVSCCRNAPTRAAAIINAISEKVPVWYDNGIRDATESTEDPMMTRIRESSMVVFFADKALFDREEKEMCDEFALTTIHGKPSLCVWLDDASGADPDRMSSDMYNLWYGLCNMPSVNVFNPADAANGAATVLAAVKGLAASPAAEPAAWQEISHAGQDAAGDNLLGTDAFAQLSSAAAVPAVQTKTSGGSNWKKRLLILLPALLLGVAALYGYYWASTHPSAIGGPSSLVPNVAYDDLTVQTAPAEYLTDVKSAGIVPLHCVMKFGTQDGEPLEWRVIEKQDDRLLLLCEKIVAEKPFDDVVVKPGLSNAEIKKLDEQHTKYTHFTQIPGASINHVVYGVNWSNCSLRQWLNGDFYAQTFTKDEQKRIVDADLNTPDVLVEAFDESVEMLDRYVLPGGGDTTDKVFLLSMDECEKYLPEVQQRTAETGWWLRSNGYGYSHLASTAVTYDNITDDYMQAVNATGEFFENSQPIQDISKSYGPRATFYGCTLGDYMVYEHGVRPAIWVRVG